MNAAHAPAIEVVGLRKTFGDTVALDGVDLLVPTGSVFALLGPNGAGKTTIVHILSTLVPADGGTVRVAGHDPATDPDDVRRAIGVTGQFSAVDGLLNARENLTLMADLCHLGRSEGRRRVAAMLERFDLADEATKPVTTYSGGMRRRLDLAMTLMGDPRIIFLDEPTTGLDPRSRRTVWDIVRGLVDDGVTILLTTHYLEEADRLADRVAVLDHGRVIADGTPEELKRTMPGGSIRLGFADVRRPAVRVTMLPGRRAGRARADAEDRERRPGGLAARDARPTPRRLGRRRASVGARAGPRRGLLGPHRRSRPGRSARMSTYVIQDSATMLRRNFRRMVRYPSVSLVVIGIPVILLLLFVYVFGGTLGAGLGAAGGRQPRYVDYVMPGILLIAIAGSAQSTAISVAMDMQEGIITRFRTMGIARASVLTAHVLGSTIQTIAGLAVVVPSGSWSGSGPTPSRSSGSPPSGCWC